MNLSPLLARLDRSLELIAELERAVQLFLASEPYLVSGQATDDGFEWRAAVRATPPIRLSLLVGDCIHNIRSPLDHLAWALSERAEVKLRRSAAFVITADAKDYATEPQQRKLRALPTSAREAMAAVQPFAADQLPPPASIHLKLETLGDFPGLDSSLEDPYSRSDDRGRAERHPLWILERLWNDDKHRLLPLVGAVSQQYRFDHAKLTIPPFSSMNLELNIGIIRDGGVIGALHFVPPYRTEATLQLRPEFDVALDREGDGFKTPIVPLLRTLEAHVRDRVLPRFRDLEP